MYKHKRRADDHRFAQPGTGRRIHAIADAEPEPASDSAIANARELLKVEIMILLIIFYDVLNNDVWPGLDRGGGRRLIIDVKEKLNDNLSQEIAPSLGEVGETKINKMSNNLLKEKGASFSARSTTNHCLESS